VPFWHKTQENDMKTFAEIRAINVNEHTEKKGQLTYLSWAWAWDIFKQQCPDVNYKIIKAEGGMPYFVSDAGVMVFTEVTVNNITHEMWLPVMDGANKAMKREAYNYKTKYGEKTVDAFDMFDVNKTIMRCLVKNLAMHGLAIYIYAGDDIPNVEPETIDVTDILLAISEAADLDVLRKVYTDAVKFAAGNEPALQQILNAKNVRKGELS
jgi:hypothetical protein